MVNRPTSHVPLHKCVGAFLLVVRVYLTVAAVDRPSCLFSQVKPFTLREFTCEGMLERVDAYITHQVAWPHRGNLGF